MIEAMEEGEGEAVQPFLLFHLVRSIVFSCKLNRSMITSFPRFLFFPSPSFEFSVSIIYVGNIKEEEEEESENSLHFCVDL